MKARIELIDLDLKIEIGAYNEDDVVPDKHILDLKLSVDPSKVLIAKDEMDQVFDYDPLVREIQQMARETHYKTQERFITRIVDECVKYDEIEAMEVFLRKAPVTESSGELGVRLQIDDAYLNHLRKK
mgnify:CR=1 FL=1